MANIDLYSVSYDSITTYLNNLDPNYSYYDRTAVWQIGTDPNILDYSGEQSLPAFISSTYNNPPYPYSFLGLSPSTTYYIGCYIWVPSMPTPVTLQTVSYTTSANPRPAYFSWDYNPTTGTSDKIQGQPFDLKATEWNNFTANINAVRQYKNYSYYWFTQAQQGVRFTAAYFNEAVDAINAMLPQFNQLPRVSSGDTITAYLMNIIVSRLNSIY